MAAHKCRPPFLPKMDNPFDIQYIDKCKSQEELEEERERRAKIYGIAQSISKEQMFSEFSSF
jgi:hypothetical protein